MTYRIVVTYAAGNSQEHSGLSAEQVETAAGAFLRDLLGLAGAGVARVEVEAETVHAGSGGRPV